MAALPVLSPRPGGAAAHGCAFACGGLARPAQLTQNCKMFSAHPVRNVSDTAFWVAHYRALETAHPKALFQDPLAARLVGDRGARIAKAMRGKAITQWSVVIRTCMIDAFVRELIKDDVDTIINLGAGLDTRPYRLDLPASLQWVEVDDAHVIDLKNACLAEERPRCQLRRIALDLNDRAARAAMLQEICAGAGKVAVLTEGVLPYLSNQAVAQLADDLRDLPKISAWVVDYFAPWIYKMLWSKRNLRQLKNAPLQFRPTDWVAFFASHRWRLRDLRYMGIEAEKLGRRPPVGLFAALKFLLATRKQREAAQKTAGYAVLEPLGQSAGSRQRGINQGARTLGTPKHENTHPAPRGGKAYRHAATPHARPSGRPPRNCFASHGHRGSCGAYAARGRAAAPAARPHGPLWY